MEPNDYKNKYLKYKNKYLSLKNQNGGKIFVSDKDITRALKFTKKEYDKLEKNEQDEFPFYCNDEKPNLCTINTPNYGLCKKNALECDKYIGEDEYLKYDLTDEKRKEQFDYGKQFGYNIYEQKDKKDCSKIVENSIKTYDGEFPIPNNFRIITFNCWWSLKAPTGDKDKDAFNEEFFKTRIKVIAEIINESNADVVCLQEVGLETFQILHSKLKDTYHYFYENPFNPDKDNDGPRKRSLETLCFTKMPVKLFRSLGAEGNLNYHNSILMLEFDNLVVFNVYLQAGTIKSPGQKDTWFNYSRCRYNQYIKIGKLLNEYKIEKPIVVLGDFNTDLNGDPNDKWYELRAFNELNLQDSWLELYDNKSGFTENTDVNLMRWNVKFEEKVLRIDGIFHTKDKIKTHKIELLGDKPIDVSDEMQKDFVKYRVPNKENKEQLIRKNGSKIQLWASDHFAVCADLEII